MSDKYKVISDNPLWVKSEDSASASNAAVIYKNDIIEVDSVNLGWYHFSKGWVYGFASNNSLLLQLVDSSSSSPGSSSGSISVGSLVNINAGASYTEESSGGEVPDWVIEQNHVVSELNDDGTKALLGFPDGIRSWVRVSDLTFATKVNVVVVPADQAKNNPATKEDLGMLSQNDLNPTYFPESDNSSDDETETYGNYASLLDGLRIKTLRGVHGMPYQYMPIADTRIDSYPGAFGRKYAEKIVARMPLLLLTPGTPEFLSGYSEAEKKSVVEYALTMFSDKSRESDLDSLLKREGRYYSLKFNWVDYYNHVNPLCRACARFLNIQDEEIDGVKLDNYDWSKNNNEEIHKHLNYRGALAFYINSDTQISESFSSSTSESMLAGKVNGMSDMGREMNFLLGGAGALTGMDIDKFTKAENLDKNVQNTSDMADRIVNGNNLIKSITGGLQTVFAGGKLIFPELWSDSQFSRSYDVEIKLTTPDPNKLSWYMDICVPLMHLVCLAAPRQAGVNGYISPFLVRGFYKGLFNCDMGLVTNMNFNRGQESSWTKDGLPTTVDVSFSIKDLYSAMAITSNKTIKHGLMNNIALMDYIANMCGVNINEPDIKRTIDMYYTQNIRNRIVDMVRLDVAGGLDQWATNKVLRLFGSR